LERVIEQRLTLPSLLWDAFHKPFSINEALFSQSASPVGGLKKLFSKRRSQKGRRNRRDPSERS
jgi:hypothetical protein